MIKTSLGKTTIEGTMATILTDYVCITKGIYGVLEENVNSEFAKEQLESAFKDAFKSNEEIANELSKCLEETDSLKDCIRNFIKALEKEVEANDNE